MKKGVHPLYGGVSARPGKSLGMTVQEVTEFIENQKRSKGFSFDLLAGNNRGLDVQLPGNSKVMLGISIARLNSGSPTALGEFSLKVNNETIIDDVNAAFLSNQFMDDEFYWYPRPISGNDDITIDFNNVAAPVTAKVSFYYV